MSGSELLLTLLGAVALLLWGVRMVRTGLLRAFGDMLRAALARAAANRASAFAAGLAVTAALQSGTATTLLVATFAGRGIVALPVALAMVLGADVGSTLVAQVFAFDIKWLWAAAVALGVGLHTAASSERLRATGRIAIGLGLMLLALEALARVGAALRGSEAMRVVLAGIGADPIIAVLVGLAATWAAHSSLAVVLLVMSLAGAGTIDGRLAVALVVGANIGSAIAPFAALAGAPVAARRVPLGNLLARLAVGLLALPLVGRAAELATQVAAAPERRVLIFHTAFNFLVALVFLPLVGPLAALVTRLLPTPAAAPDPAAPLHLEPTALASPPEALGCAMRETLHVGDIVLDMLRRSLGALSGNDLEAVKAIERTDDVVDRLHEAIKLYLVRASKADLSDDEARRYAEILTFNTNLEHIGDIIDKNLMELAAKKIRRRYAFSDEGLAELERFHAEVVDNMRLALVVFATRDDSLARRLVVAKDALREREQVSAERHYARLRQGLAQSLETSAIHLDVIRDLKRINAHLTSVAYPILEARGELAGSRLKGR